MEVVNFVEAEEAARREREVWERPFFELSGVIAQLLTAFRNYTANEWDARQRLRRGGGYTFLSLDSGPAEEQFRIEPADLLTPERLFDRAWAETVVGLVLGKLRDEYNAAGELDRFEALQLNSMGFHVVWSMSTLWN